jgi:DeoR/GlpR family transcriptional regulator of sugar metabolism
MSEARTVPKIRRKDEILRILYEQGHVEVRIISETFNVSEATVRRDLRRMNDEGLLELVYGGATLPRKGNFSLRSRQTRNMEAKRLIGQMAADLVRNGDSIFIDSGTTCCCMVPHLLMRQDLSIITNSNLVAAEIGERTNFNVLQLGGKFRFERMDSIGPFAQMVIEQLSGYRAFIGADGLALDIGMTTTDVETAHLYRSVIQHASEITLLADHTKFNAPALYKILGIDAVNRIVTDLPPPKEWADCLERNGIDVILPAPAPGNADYGTGARTEALTDEP